MKYSPNLLLLTATLLGGCYNTTSHQPTKCPRRYRPPLQVAHQKESNIKFIEIGVEQGGAMSLTKPNAPGAITHIPSITRYLKNVDKNSTIQLNISTAANGKDLVKTLDFCKSMGFKNLNLKRVSPQKRWSRNTQTKNDLRIEQRGILMIRIMSDGTLNHNQQEIDQAQFERLLASKKFKSLIIQADHKTDKAQIQSVMKLSVKHGVRKVSLTATKRTE